ncbi:flavodoxin domain-containing protein [Cellulomonas alba]|uniref:Flavodoxin domain-containing protein n=1 Tax=Cellulomonas alba TaxID=3053467 RepID=A0ABT7SHX4_9CELL|nr:flavodoxin domain-containing protein [Cellulomonas alba]MDM7855152.1 flavodoxin domain-containing protein [Cellulomonas alba]
MAVLVVFESMYGSTQSVAEAIGAGLASAGQLVTVAEVGRAGEPRLREGVALLVVGGPTHNRGMSSARSRERARAEGRATVSPADGVREWLDALGTSAVGVRAVAFDTAVASRFAGSAAHRIGQRLRAAGARRAAAPQSFVVAGRDAGLVAGELDRAWEWGRLLGTIVAAVPRPLVR